MKELWFFLTSLLLSPFLAHASTLPQQAPLSGAGEIPSTFRRATLDDIDDITTTLIDAFRAAPLWKYIRPSEEDVEPGYTWSCQRDFMRRLYLNESEPHNASVFYVIAVPDPTSRRGERAVSVAIWDFTMIASSGSVPHASPPPESSRLHAGLKLLAGDDRAGGAPGSGSGSGPLDSRARARFDCAANLDKNMTRAAPLVRALEGAERAYLDEPLGAQLRLALLATHPSWDGHGFAARHLRWGKGKVAALNRRRGREHRLPITLLATPAGYPLYRREGFEGLKNVTVERLDGEGVFWYEAMKYDDKTE